MENKNTKKNIYLTGITSFFTDISSEMIYPILPFFLRTVLGVTPAFIGIIEGIAESTAALSKTYFGRLADKFKHFKSLVIIGYLFSSLSKMILIFANFWAIVLGARFLDKIGKGIRTAPRDAIISESVNAQDRGKAFGIQRAMDFTGACLGVFFAYLILRYIGVGSNINVYKNIFIIAIIPAFLAVIFLLFVAVPDTLNSLKSLKAKSAQGKALNKKLVLFLSASSVFSLGNSSNQFLLLRSQDIGFTLLSSILLYLSYNVVSSILSPFFGKLSDTIGRKKVIVYGYLLYSIVYLSFGLFSKQWLFWLIWPLYGLYSAMTEGVEKAFVSDLSESQNRGFSLGLYSTIVGIGVLPASLLAGFLYTFIGSYAPFVLGGSLSLLSILIILFI